MLHPISWWRETRKYNWRINLEKLLTVVACGAIMMSAFGTTVLAASGINCAEQKILDYMEKGFTIEGETIAYGPGTEEYDLIKELLEIDGVDTTEFQKKLEIYLYETIKKH